MLRQGLSLIVDQLHSATTHAYTQTWHLDPSAVLDQSGQDAFVSTPDGRRLLTIRQADPAGETLTALKGQTSPVMAGWYSNAYGSKTPGYQLQYTRHATDAQFTTLLTAGAYATQTSTVTEHPANNGTEVDLCVGDNIGYTITIPTDESAALTVTGGACPAAVASTSAPDPNRAALPTPDLTQSTADRQAFTTLPVRADAIPVLLFHSNLRHGLHLLQRHPERVRADPADASLCRLSDNLDRRLRPLVAWRAGHAARAAGADHLRRRTTR